MKLRQAKKPLQKSQPKRVVTRGGVILDTALPKSLRQIIDDNSDEILDDHIVEGSRKAELGWFDLVPDMPLVPCICLEVLRNSEDMYLSAHQLVERICSLCAYKDWVDVLPVNISEVRQVMELLVYVGRAHKKESIQAAYRGDSEDKFLYAISDKSLQEHRSRKFKAGKTKQQARINVVRMVLSMPFEKSDD